MRLEGRVAVVTGGSSGIGLAIAREFAAEGARLVVFGRNQSGLDAAKTTIGGVVLAVRGDVTRIADLERLFSEAIKHFSRIDVVVANAGIASVTPVESIEIGRASCRERVCQYV